VEERGEVEERRGERGRKREKGRKRNRYREDRNGTKRGTADTKRQREGGKRA